MVNNSTNVYKTNNHLKSLYIKKKHDIWRWKFRSCLGKDNKNMTELSRLKNTYFIIFGIYSIFWITFDSLYIREKNRKLVVQADLQMTNLPLYQHLKTGMTGSCSESMCIEESYRKVPTTLYINTKELVWLVPVLKVCV